jgi:ubiquitin C-terminal hydrolase
MNSVIQQLFHVEEFRHLVLSSEEVVQLHQEREVETSQSKSFFPQFQTMFASLCSGHQRYYDTMPFCESLKDDNGVGINLMQQRDANEFYNEMMFKLEECFSSNKYYEDLFRGRIAHVTT